MTDSNPTPPPSTRRLRVAQTLSLVGMVGLCAAFFLPYGSFRHVGYVTPSEEVFFAGFWESGNWAVFTVFLLAPIALLFRTVCLFVRGRWLIAVSGWAACLLLFAGLMAAVLVIWKELAVHEIASNWSDISFLIVLSCVTMTGIAALAMIALCSLASGLARLAACFAVFGVWSLCFFLSVISGWSGLEEISHGLYVSLASSLLVAVGGIWETKLLWRRA